MRRSQVIMGTGVTIDIPGATSKGAFDEAFKLLKRIDNRFSTYKPSSEVRRYNNGQLPWYKKSREFRKIFKACHAAQASTDGVFSAWASMPISYVDAAQGNSEERTSRTRGTVSERESVIDTAPRRKPWGVFGSAEKQPRAVRNRHYDPSGYVKGWAIEQASKIIEKAGFSTYCISIGGDIYARGDKDWTIGVQDPKNTMKTLVNLKIKNLAVATSGNYTRGAHIINPKTGKPANKLASVTVVGPNIIDADVLATSAFVLGDFALNFIGGQAKCYEALIIEKSGKIKMTKGFDKYIH